MKRFNSIEDFCENVAKGSFGIYAATMTPKKMNKYPCGCGRVAGTENPYEGRVFNLAIIQNAASGVSYYKLVESECKREGIAFSKDAFEQAFPKEKSYVEEVSDKLSNMIVEHATSGQRYLRLYFGRKPTHTIYHTILTDENGCNAKVLAEDSKELQDIMRYVPAKSGSAKQESLGITNIIEVRQPKIENVVFLMQGDKLFLNKDYEGVLDADALGSELYAMFKKNK